jgi:hypothetical protein
MELGADLANDDVPSADNRKAQVRYILMCVLVAN